MYIRKKKVNASKAVKSNTKIIAADEMISISLLRDLSV